MIHLDYIQVHQTGKGFLRLSILLQGTRRRPWGKRRAMFRRLAEWKHRNYAHLGRDLNLYTIEDAHDVVF